MRTASAGQQDQDLSRLEEELQHQMKKSTLLETDRTTFFNNAQETKKQNNEMINQLRSQNKQLKNLRDELIANKRATTPGLSKTQGAFMTWSGDIRDENYWRRKYDEARHSTKALREDLLTLQDKLNEVSDTQFGAVEESPLMRQIRVLENNLDQVMIKYNEAQSIQKTYEQIVKRLKEERVGYDNQLAAIERSLQGKQHDFEELLLLAHDATHAKELAQAELKKYDHKKTAVRELRKNYLEEKKQQIEMKDEISNQIDRKDNNQDFLGDKSQVNQGNELNINTNDFAQRDTYDSSVQKQKLLDYEEAFRKLYEATGVTDVNEIIQQFTTQEETTKSLNELRQDYLNKIDDLQKKKQELKKKLNTYKYEGGDTLTRKQIDEIESNVNNATNKCQRTQLQYDRVAQILVNVKSGIQHLYEKLEFYKLDGKPNIIVTDQTLVDALAQIVEKMKQIYQPVKNDPSYDPQDYKQTAQGVANYINLNLMDKNAKIETLTRNIRVKLPDQDDDQVSNQDMDQDLDMEQNAQFQQKYQAQAQNDKNARSKSKKGSIMAPVQQ